MLATDSYRAFLAGKRLAAPSAGIDVDPAALHSALFGWQRQIVKWALARGRAALFEDCGLGKTPQQLEWARHVSMYTERPSLILAPLAVAQQTRREGEKFGIGVTVCRTQADARPGVNVTNYEMLRHFNAAAFGGLVLDESSILKGFDGALRKEITAFAQRIHFRLACTATPAPNDLIELTNHAEFLDILSGKEIVALFFMQDGNTTNKWRLKGHARRDFWRWLASWSVAVRAPSDLGAPDDGFALPPLRTHQITVPSAAPPGYLFPIEAKTLTEVRTAQRASLDARVEACAALVNGSSEQWLVWCHLNAESAALAAAIPDAVEVKGSDSLAHKEDGLLGFAEGRYRVLVSKPSIAGFGLNLQRCARVVFVGLSYSYEQFYQAVRRCWRYGQTRPVDCYLVTSEAEGAVLQAIERKEAQAQEMMREIVGHMAGLQLDRASRHEMDYAPAQPMRLPAWLRRYEAQEGVSA
jgi:hypothetical protein